jgi:hypothetical protein
MHLLGQLPDVQAGTHAVFFGSRLYMYMSLSDERDGKRASDNQRRDE